MKYLLVGDIHGKFAQFRNWLDIITKKDIEFDEIIQVGDFGIYPFTLLHLAKSFNDSKYKIHFIQGNHEDHNLIPQISSDLKTYYNIYFHLPGEKFTIDDNRTIVLVGGAMNVDRPQSLDGDGNHLNFPNKIDVNRMNIYRNDKIDLMITHTCPHSIGIGMKGSFSYQRFIEKECKKWDYDIPPLDDAGDYFLTRIWNKLKTKPINWVFGHFHQYYKTQIKSTNFYCIGATDKFYNHNSFSQIKNYNTKTNKITIKNNE